MKTIQLSLLLLCVSSFLSLAAHSEQRVDCVEWSKKVLEIFDDSASSKIDSFQLKKNGKIQDLIQLQKDFPLAEAYQVPRLGKDTNVEKAVSEFLKVKSCHDILYYSVMNRALTSKSVSLKNKQEMITILLNRIVQERDSSPSTINLLLRIRLIQSAIEAKVLKVSDVLYLKVGSISNDVQMLKDRGADKNWAFDWTCAEKHNCSTKDYKELYEAIHDEYFGAKMITQELVWLVKRLK